MFLFMDQKDLIVHCRLPPLYRLFLIMTVELSMGENSNIYELISLTLSFTNFYTFGVIYSFHINLRYMNLTYYSPSILLHGELQREKEGGDRRLFNTKSYEICTVLVL